MRRGFGLAMVLSVCSACNGRTTDIQRIQTFEGGAASVGGAASETDASAAGGSLATVDSGLLFGGGGRLIADGSVPSEPPPLCLHPTGQAPHSAYFVAYDASASAAGQNFRFDVLQALADTDGPGHFVGITLQWFPIGTPPQSCTAHYDIPYASGMHDVLRGVDGLATLGPRAVGPAYKGMIDQAKASTEFGLGGVVVLVTTGAPEDCSPSSYADLAAMATDAATSQPMVRTAVIGPADLPGPYDDVARAGLTDHAYRVSGGAQDARGAAQFLLSLDKDWGACEFDISLPGTGEPLDPAPLALTQSSMKGTTSEIPQVASSDACGNARGWYADYNTAMLCAKSCSENQANVVTAVYGCHSIGQTH